MVSFNRNLRALCQNIEPDGTRLAIRFDDRLGPMASWVSFSNSKWFNHNLEGTQDANRGYPRCRRIFNHNLICQFYLTTI